MRMVSIFNYHDFRVYLKDYFEEQKSQHVHFSYSYFSEKIGFNNKGFLYNIINKSKKLSSSHVAKLCAAMKLDLEERYYFEALVAYCQATTASERSRYFNLLASINAEKPDNAPCQTINRDQYAYFAKWYHSAIRSLIGLHPNKNDAKWIAQRLRAPLKGWEIRRSIKLMQRLGLLHENDKGELVLDNRIISTGSDAQAAGLLDFYLQHLELAAEALRNIPRDKRRFEGITLGISKKSYDMLCAEFSVFIEKALAIAKNDTEADSVYQCMLQLYPLTKPLRKEKSREKSA